ncbi:MAG TPA: amidohydrolase family protein, partial [Saprospiraceae bacterium]|nr:amidohydrolase family protein [Saprospiraceae bacterium]
NFPVAVHAQGDRANDEVVDVFKKIHAKNAINHYRHRIEHCMLLPKERLSDMKNMSITPSFHINHILYYGDFLDKEILGEERAARIFPLQSTLEAGLPYSLHADMPQFVPSPLALAHTSVHRQTESGAVYNENERVSVMQALKSITIHAAWQLHLEDKLGSIEKGKYADLVILDQNPLKTTSEQMTSIRVLETIVAGNTVWKQQAAPGAAQ